MTKTQRMRELINGPNLCISPGIYDGYSARLVETSGFKTASISGTGICSSRLGRAEETGIMSLLENVDACRHIAGCVSIPIMADADTGYGNAVTVFHTVRYFEDAGIVGINIEDQSWPKRCGHLPGKELISPMEMAKKIEAATTSRRDPDFIINARTDAIAVEGFDAALERAKLYAKAGADLIYVEMVQSEEQISNGGRSGQPHPYQSGIGHSSSRHVTSDFITTFGRDRSSKGRLTEDAYCGRNNGDEEGDRSVSRKCRKW